jgi:adenylate cyclase
MEHTIDTVDAGLIRAELARVLSSAEFRASDRHRSFLTYIVEETLAGRAERLKAYSIATQAFNRGPDFDPQQDSIVRIEAGRLRRALEHFYLTDGRKHEVQILVPKGSYVPHFRLSGESPEGQEPVPARPGGPFPQRRAPRILVTTLRQEGTSDALPDFAPGLTRQLIFGLTRFSHVHVFGAETSATYGFASSGDHPASALALDYVLSGSVEVSGRRFAVDLLLQDQASHRYVWAERFEREFDAESILSLRAEVAGAVAQKLAQPYGILFSRALDNEGDAPVSLDGYRAVLNFYQYVRNFRKDMFEQTKRGLEKAIEQDPGFAEGYACLSQIHSHLARFSSNTPAKVHERASEALRLANRALLLAPNSSNAHHALALAKWFSGETAGSIEAYETALSLNPANTDLMADLGLRYCLLMQWERGVPLVEEAYARNPCQPNNYRMALVLYHFHEGQHREGLVQARMLNAPDVVYNHLAIAVCAVRLGLRDEALEAVGKIEEVAPDYAVCAADDLAARNVHPALARELVRALEDAGLGRAAPTPTARAG